VTRAGDSSSAPILVSALKAYGDFVIALISIRRLRQDPRRPKPVVLAGRHLQSLAKALGVEPDVRFIGGDWTDVPAAFDVGQRGKVAAIRSLFDLRRRLGILEPSTLLFDRIGLRETFIGARHARVGLPPHCENIYLAYERLFDRLGFLASPAPPANIGGGLRRAVIVPGSRVDRKTLPSDVIAALHSQLTASAIDSQVLLLEQESVHVPAHVPSVTLPRRFEALIEALSEADLVISADSLAAHLAEFSALPSFVVSPLENPYWLPRSSYLSRAHATFDDLGPLAAWLERRTQADVSAA
jgi:hypothetical protein